MKSIVFLACIVLARTSPTNDGALLPIDIFPLDLSRFVLFSLTIRPLPYNQLNSFDDSFVPNADDALEEAPSHPTLDIFPLSNDLLHPSDLIKHDRDYTDSNRIENYSSELPTAGNSFWDDIMAIERESMDLFIADLTEFVKDQDAHSDQHPGAVPSSHHIIVEQLQDIDRESTVPEQGTFPVCTRYK